MAYVSIIADIIGIITGALALFIGVKSRTEETPIDEKEKANHNKDKE